MHNIQLAGVTHMDQFSLKGCFLVIGSFGLVTLISYFNELAKAGLLSGSPKMRLMNAEDTFRQNLHEIQPYDQVEPYKRELDAPPDTAKDKIILHKGRDFHHLDLNLLPLERQMDNVHNKTNQEAGEEEQEIQIALHLGKNAKYVQANESDTKIYQFHNVLPNFYLKINASLTEVMKATKNLTGKGRDFVSNFTQTELYDNLVLYRNRSKVLVYQHDPGGYALRDCLLSSSLHKKLVVAQVPLNAIYRKNWELMDREQRDKYEFLYGSLSFGACEGRSEECTYAAMISHPLDRLLQAYSLCNEDSNRTMCRFFRTENITTIHGFLERHGNALFQKLLYYSRHCRLVGHDEVCIHDNDVYFVLSPDEKVAYLTDILSNVERWFSVVGIMDELESSLNLISSVLGLDLPQCLSSEYDIPLHFFQIFHKFNHFHLLNHTLLKNLRIDDIPYFMAREKLLMDPDVMQWISADMEIYAKFVEIFNRQRKVYNDLKHLKEIYFSQVKNIPSESQNLTEQSETDVIKTIGIFSNGNYSRNVLCSFIDNQTECKFVHDNELLDKGPSGHESERSHKDFTHNDEMTLHTRSHSDGRRHPIASKLSISQNTPDHNAQIPNRFGSDLKFGKLSLFELKQMEQSRTKKHKNTTASKSSHLLEHLNDKRPAEKEPSERKPPLLDELTKFVRSKPFGKLNVFNGKKQQNV